MNILVRSSFFILLFLFSLQQFYGTTNAYAVSGGNEYEIPLNELKKVEKKKNQRTESRHIRHTKRSSKKTDRKSQESAPVRASAPEDNTVRAMPLEGLPASAVTEINNEKKLEELLVPVISEIKNEMKHKALPVPAVTEIINEKTNVPADTVVLKDNARITHEPYSYIVTGKRTKLRAIISSRHEFESVVCKFRASDQGPYVLVSMAKADGSVFTYTATIPSLAPGAKFLNYQFVTVDTEGVETRSQEYVIKVNRTTIVPGWQTDPSPEAITIITDPSGQTPVGFADVLVEDKDI